MQQHATDIQNRREPVWVCRSTVCKHWHEAKPNRGRCRLCQGEVLYCASKAEARRYAELVLLEQHELIRELETQPQFPIRVVGPDGGGVVEVGWYAADFRYVDSRTGRRIVEDVKGHETDLFAFKKRLVEAAYGIVITVIRA